MKELVFKIMRERDGGLLRQIPLRVIAPHEEQAVSNHFQTLARLNQRGGLSAKEALHVLYDLRWDRGDESQRVQLLTQEEADAELRRVVSERYQKLVAIEKEEQARREVPCSHDRPDTMPEDATGAKRCPKCRCLIFETGG